MQASGGTGLRLLAVALAVVLALLATSRSRLAVSSVSAPRLLSSTLRHLPSLQEEINTCKQYPTLRVKKVLHNNFGEQGPDTGEEGIIYHVVDPLRHADFEMVVSALPDSDFKVFDPHKAGLWGQYQAVNMMPGGRVHAQISFRSSRTKEPVIVPALDITFFDFDEESPGVGREILQVHRGWSDYVIKQSTTLNTTRTGSDLRFEGTVVGSGTDNPVDPEHMTEEQARKAVSLSYRDVHSFNITMSCTPGNWPRFFIFVARASLICEDAADGGSSDVKVARRRPELASLRPAQQRLPEHRSSFTRSGPQLNGSSDYSVRAAILRARKSENRWESQNLQQQKTASGNQDASDHHATSTGQHEDDDNVGSDNDIVVTAVHTDNDNVDKSNSIGKKAKHVDNRGLHQESDEVKSGGPGLMLPVIFSAAVAAACVGVLGSWVAGGDSMRDMRVEPHELVSLRLADLTLEEEERAAEAAEAARLAKVPHLITIFESPDGESRKKVISFNRPLSVSCQLQLPMLVENVVAKGEADTAGIQRGWVLCEFGDAAKMQQVEKSGGDAKFQEAYEQLLILTKRLPPSK